MRLLTTRIHIDPARTLMLRSFSMKASRGLENIGRAVILARKTEFSSGHLYHQPKFSEEKNKEVFGRCFTPHGHGHNYTLQAFFRGEIDGDSGMVVNLTDVDHVLKEVTDPLDHQHLNFDIPFFKTHVPTTENIARYCFDEIAKRIGAIRMKLVKVRLFEMDDLWVEYSGTSMAVSKTIEITKKYILRSLHNLEHPSLNDNENSDLYGKCFRLHGHDYKIYLTLASDIDSKTGLALKRDETDRVVAKEILEKYEGHNLNEHFANTSGESLVCLFHDILKPHLPNLVKVGLQETRKNYFEYPVL